MKLLLDTHIWIWSVLDPTRLSRRVARALENPGNQLWLSPISIWELIMLTRKGRVQLDEDVVSWTRRTLEQWQLQEAPLTNEVALETSTLNLAHSDPSDRLIAASAKVFDLTLVTADEKLIAVSGIKVLACR
ncbi:MAG TPA: type II toxin-antitoxin system VapC family toxin [Candidatus Aquilonibacter sp.]|nr:type II toxin-antitoxin system VapC family toxin [Candidatus Aquilonibacter sp.]